MAAAPVQTEAPETSGPAPRPQKTPARSGARGPIRRAQIGFSVVTQILIVTLLVCMVNYLGYKHFKRWDLSRDGRFSLSERTTKFLNSLTQPVRLITFMSDGALLRGDAVELINAYKQARPGFINIEQVNPYRDIARATELQAKYKLGQADNVVIIDCEGRQKLVEQDALADLDRSGEMFGQAPQVVAFKGEQAITGAMLEVVEGKKNLLYYLRGQAQPELGARGPVGVLQTFIERDNVQFKDLNLLNADAVPADASAVLLAGARYDISEREAKALEDYWNKQGRLFILLNPDATTPRLLAFLDKVGIKADDSRITRTVTLGVTKDGAGIVLRAPEIGAEFTGANPIVQRLKGVNLVLSGATQPLTLEPERVRGANVKVEPLAQAQRGFWGEADYKETEGAGVGFDAGRDKDKNLVIAAAAERGAVAEGRVGVGSARMVVLSNSRFIENESLDQNKADFFQGALNWLLDRERLIGIPPKEVKTFSVNLPEGQIFTLFTLTVFAIPAMMALVGVMVWWRRRA